ncbi:MAG: DUF1207 domain-containing protein [Pirellulales bacterium]
MHAATEPPPQPEHRQWLDDWSRQLLAESPSPSHPWLDEPDDNLHGDGGQVAAVDFQTTVGPPPPRADEPWTWQVMPSGLLYSSYLAGTKEPRFAAQWNRDRRLGPVWDTAIGGRLGILRYGTTDPILPSGWQVDLEGGFQARLDPTEDSMPLTSVDFRIGVPITWANGPWQFKTGYYHVSAHLGDEYMLMHPTAQRLNYVRDAAMLGVGYYWTEMLRLYCEVAYAASVSDGAEPWEFQFGVDYAPAGDTGLRGAPFAAFNAHLREEVGFGGNLVIQFGWAWRHDPRGPLFRAGLQYYRGKSGQYEFYDQSERLFGWGLWADF